VPDDDIGEVWIALCRENRERVPDKHNRETAKPHLQAQADRGGESAIKNGDRSWRSRQKDRFGQGAVK